MFLQILLNAHVSACVFHLIAWKDIKDNQLEDGTWLHAFDLVDKDWDLRYIFVRFFFS